LYIYQPDFSLVPSDCLELFELPEIFLVCEASAI
jgi:hypothetical protein